MKKIGILLYYLFFLIGGTVIVSFVYITYTGCANLVAGREFNISKELVLFGLLGSVGLVIFLVPTFVSAYKIRHLENPISSALIYSGLCLFTWLVIFPLVQVGESLTYNQEKIDDFLSKNITLTEGYFRKVENNLYYFLDESDENCANVLKISSTNNVNQIAEQIMLDISTDSEFAKNTAPFKDPCIQGTFDKIPDTFFIFIAILKNRATFAWSNGFLSWLFFCTLGLALCSVYSYAGVSSWRLMNLSFIITTELLIIFTNAMYLSSAGEKIRLPLNQLFYGKENDKLPFFCNRGIDIPISIFNVLVAISVIAVSSIIKAVKRKKAEK